MGVKLLHLICRIFRILNLTVGIMDFPTKYTSTSFGKKSHFILGQSLKKFISEKRYLGLVFSLNDNNCVGSLIERLYYLLCKFNSFFTYILSMIELCRDKVPSC